MCSRIIFSVGCGRGIDDATPRDLMTSLDLDVIQEEDGIQKDDVIQVGGYSLG